MSDVGDSAGMLGLLTRVEAAKALRISVRKLADLTKAGLVRCRRVGKRVLYFRDDLAAYVMSLGVEKAG